MPLSRRYSPEHPPGESCLFGLDFSGLIPAGEVITVAALAIHTNVNPPAAADADWSVGPVQVQDYVVYATLSGGKDGVDYLLTWTATASDGSIWPRTAAVLCAQTS